MGKEGSSLHDLIPGPSPEQLLIGILTVITEGGKWPLDCHTLEVEHSGPWMICVASIPKSFSR